jgi:DNA-binding winged helix-turn-helix (wHTH) protein
VGRVRRDGAETRLRHKSHRLLVYLIDHRSGPVGKEQLIRDVWDGAAVGDDTLVNCVQEIRKALGDDARSPVFIRTMPKAGYWFVAKVEVLEVEPEPAPTAAERPSVPIKKKARPWVWLSAAAVAGVAIGLAGVPLWRTSPVPVAWGEAGWWKLDEGAGNELRDSVTGAAAALPRGVGWTAGAAGSGLRYTGVDVLVGGRTRPLPPPGAGRTLLATVRLERNTADAATIVELGDPDRNRPLHSFGLAVYQDGRAGVHSNRASVLGSTRVDDGEWHRLAGVFEGSNQRGRIYVDGVEQGSGVLTDAFLESGAESRWSIGRALWGGTPVRGDIDDVRIFTRALRPGEVVALHRCLSGAVDLEIPGRGGYYFVPIFGGGAIVEDRPSGGASSPVRNAGLDYGGVAFVRRQPDCALRDTHASDLGQDVTIEADIRVGGDSSDRVNEAGPYFRSRRSTPGDGIVGGASAGYWVQLKSTGQVRVRRLNPSGTVAFTAVPDRFDPHIFHRLKTSVMGNRLRVELDHKPLEFDQVGTRTMEVAVPPDWESSTPRGQNHGAAGIGFSAEGNRFLSGGQEVRNIRVY